jgi:hypothetical protein
MSGLANLTNAGNGVSVTCRETYQRPDMTIFAKSRLCAALMCLLVASCLRGQVTVQVGLNFTGNTYGDISQATPPDPNGAIGPNHFVEFINGAVSVYDRTDGQSVLGLSDVDFWSQAGVNISAVSAISDPRVIYDPTSQRWFASQVDFNSTATDPTLQANNFLLAVSDSSDPTGTWHGFKFRADPTTGRFADFPTLGVDTNGVYLSGDFYHGESNPVGPGLVSIPKADLLAVTPTISNRHWFGVMSIATRGEVMQPAVCFDGSESGNILAMGDIGTTSDPYSNMVCSVVQNAGATSPTLSAPVRLTVTPYQVPDNDNLGVPQFTVPQPDGTTMLQANDPRLSARVYAVGGVLYAVHNTELNGRMAVQWYRIRASDHKLMEQGTISDPNLDLFMPSIAANQYGIVVIACNGSSFSTYVSCYAYAGQTVNGQTSFGNQLLLESGVVSYHDVNDILGDLLGTPTPSRWGDYSTLSVDAADPTQFWSIQMYPSGIDSASGLDEGIWSTQITQLIVTAPPQLAISRSGTNVVVSWPLYASSYQLQSRTNLTAGANWALVAQTPSTNGLVISVTVPRSGKTAFFRLQH